VSHAARFHLEHGPENRKAFSKAAWAAHRGQAAWAAKDIETLGTQRWRNWKILS
jgi:hypothetical protein